MTLRMLAYLGRISAVNAQVAGMVADNAQQESMGNSPAFVGGHFVQCEQELNNIVNEIEGDRRQGLE